MSSTPNTVREIRRRLVEIVYEEEFHLNKSEKVKKLEALIHQSDKRVALEARLVELDLLEQALNTGVSINRFKLTRLKALTDQLADLTKGEQL